MITLVMAFLGCAVWGRRLPVKNKHMHTESDKDAHGSLRPCITGCNSQFNPLRGVFDKQKSAELFLLQLNPVAGWHITRPPTHCSNLPMQALEAMQINSNAPPFLKTHGKQFADGANYFSHSFARFVTIFMQLNDSGKDQIPSFLYKLNSASKWWVVFAQTAAVVMTRDLIAPFIVVGSICSAFGTALLKKLINQQRPDGAPFTDPGMPSSHALVSSFAAVAWACYMQSLWARVLLVSAAAYVSVLRVVCGYHDAAQVLVGVGIGGVSACGWMALGRAMLARADHGLLAAVVWTSYVGGSALFIGKKMASWAGKDAAL